MKSYVQPKNLVFQFILYFVLLTLGILCFVPLIIVISASLTDEVSLIKHGYSLFPKDISFVAYEYILKQPKQIIQSYGITIFVTIVGTIVSLLVTGLLAYPLSRRDFKYRNSLSFYVFFTMLFNGGLVPWYIIITRFFHLKDTIWALILPYLVVPFFVLMMRTFFSAFPYEIIESAKIDGLGEYRLFFKIIVPLSTPVLATVGLFTSLMYWNDWYLALFFIENRKLIPLQYLLYNILENANALSLLPIKNQVPPSETIRMATAVLAIGPIILVYSFFQKYYVRGLTVGAIKG